MKTLKLFITLGLVVSLLQTCRKDEESSSDTTEDTTSVQNASVADVTTDSDISMSMDLSQSYGIMNKTTNGLKFLCANVTIDSANTGFPKTFTLDFGTTGCTSPNGITRKGKVIITFSNKVRTVGSVVTITRENYYVNDYKVEGTVVYTNITTNASTPAWSKVVNDGKITNPNGSYFQFTTNRKQKMIEGASTPLILSDDVFEVYEGTHNVVRSNGTFLNTTVKTPLIKRNTCQYISKGSVTLKGSVLDGTLDFGNGDCDNLAVYTNANGVSHQITL